MALHERFRGEIVKAAPRGMWTGGRELPAQASGERRAILLTRALDGWQHGGATDRQRTPRPA